MVICCVHANTKNDTASNSTNELNVMAVSRLKARSNPTARPIQLHIDLSYHLKAENVLVYFVSMQLHKIAHISNELA